MDEWLANQIDGCIVRWMNGGYEWTAECVDREKAV